MDTFIVSCESIYLPELVLNSWKIDDIYTFAIVHVDSVKLSIHSKYPANCYISNMCKLGNRILLKLSQCQDSGSIGLVTLVYLINEDGKLVFDYEFLKVKQLQWSPYYFCSKTGYYYHIDNETACFNKIRIYDINNKGNEIGIIETTFHISNVFLLNSTILLELYNYGPKIHAYEKDKSFVDLSVLLKDILPNSGYEVRDIWTLNDFIIYKKDDKLIISKVCISIINKFNIIDLIQLEDSVQVYGRKEYVYIDGKIRETLIINSQKYSKIFIYEKNEKIYTKNIESYGNLLEYEVKFSLAIKQKYQHTYENLFFPPENSEEFISQMVKYQHRCDNLFFPPKNREEFISQMVKNSTLLQDVCNIIFQYYFCSLYTI